MGKVPEYNLRAINKYNSKFDRVAVNLPIGSKEKIRELTGKSCNSYISELVMKDLERLEKGTEIETESALEPKNDPDFSAYEKRKAETENLQTIEELQEYVLMRQSEEEKRRAENPEPVEDVPIRTDKPKDPPPDDDALTKKLEEIRERRKQAQEENG